MDYIKKEILNCLGAFPKKTALDLRELECTACDGYTRRLIEYSVEAGERVQSYLLVPSEKKEKYPAVLAIHQHAGIWEIGKSEVVGLTDNEMFSYGIDLVKRGFVVIAPDLLCFESRMGDAFKEDKPAQSNYEKFEYFRYLLNGSSLQAKYLHDLSVAVDALESLSYVDNEKIGTIGHSLGGQEATWITWYDERVKAGVSSCGIGTLKSIYENNLTHNFALYLPGFLNVCDTDGLVSSLCPKAFLMLSGEFDYPHFPLEGVRAIESAAEKAYRENGVEEQFRSVVFDGKHVFRDSEKELAYGWLAEKLGV